MSTGLTSPPEDTRLVEVWRRDHNVSRPHMGLDYLPPQKTLPG